MTGATRVRRHALGPVIVLLVALVVAVLVAGCGSGVDRPEPPVPSSPSTPTTPATPTSGPSTPPPSLPPTTPPAPTEPTTRTLTVASFNALGSNHTKPGGSRPDWPSGVERTRGLVERVRFYAPDLLGLQELQAAQLASVRDRVGDRFGSYAIRDNALLWRRSVFTLLERTSLTIPYFGGRLRAMPVVRLRLTGSRTEVTVIDVHNPASVHGNARAFRAAAVQVERSYVAAERAAGRVVFLVGDFNDREAAFCPLTRGGLMTSARAGSHAGGICAPPANPQIDWIFGSRARFDGYVSDVTTRGALVSDHPFLAATATIRVRP